MLLIIAVVSHLFLDVDLLSLSSLPRYSGVIVV